MPGAFFHAYTEPTWGAQVFGDNFDSSAIRPQWLVVNGDHYGYGNGQCSFDSDVFIDTSYDAIDG